MKTLLERAQEVKIHNRGSKKPVTSEEIELFFALISEKISVIKASVALYGEEKGRSAAGSGKVYARAVPVLKEAYRKGKIKFL